MKAGGGMMAIEVVVKWVIVLIVVAVVTELFLSFSNQIKPPFKDDSKNLDFPKIVEQDKFSVRDISNRIMSCYSTMTSLPDDEQKDIVCYTLLAEANFSSFVTKSDILNDLDSEVRDKVEIKTDLNKDRIIIKFKDIGDKIIVTDSVKE